MGFFVSQLIIVIDIVTSLCHLGMVCGGSACPVFTVDHSFCSISTDSAKATSRSQLEAARARFFADLMNSSDIFKENSQSLQLSSESLPSTPNLNSPSQMHGTLGKVKVDGVNNNSLEVNESAA